MRHGRAWSGVGVAVTSVALLGECGDSQEAPAASAGAVSSTSTTAAAPSTSSSAPAVGAQGFGDGEHAVPGVDLRNQPVKGDIAAGRYESIMRTEAQNQIDCAPAPSKPLCVNGPMRIDLSDGMFIWVRPEAGSTLVSGE